MSDDKTYTEEVKHFSSIVEELTKELRSFKNEISGKLDKMSDQIEKNRQDADNLTEGNKRHGIEPVRQIAEQAKGEADRANDRLDKLKYMVAGAAGGGGVGGAWIFDIIESLL